MAGPLPVFYINSMDNFKIILAVAGLLVFLTGVMVAQKLNIWFPSEPAGSETAERDVLKNGQDMIEKKREDELIVENGSASLDEGKALMTSCDMIEEKGICVEYTGSYWSKEALAAANCRGNGDYSKSACPRPAVGGCKLNKDREVEIISWYYDSGEEPMALEDIDKVRDQCNDNYLSVWTEDRGAVNLGS